MPSIELLGYTNSQRETLEKDLRDDLGDLPFCHEIVFVYYSSEVFGFKGDQQQYLRVSTRNQQKADVLLERLKKYADVEFLKTQDIVFKDE